MIFRQANLNDIDGIMEMVKRIIKGPNTVWDEEYPVRDNFLESLKYDGLYVALDNDKIIATVGIEPAEDVFLNLPCWTKANKPAVGCRLGIDPDYQGKHISIPFQKYCLNDIYNRKGYDYFRFFVDKINTRAIHVYERFGYTRVGETNWIGEDWYCYECKLPVKE